MLANASPSELKVLPEVRCLLFRCDMVSFVQGSHMMISVCCGRRGVTLARCIITVTYHEMMLHLSRCSHRSEVLVRQQVATPPIKPCIAIFNKLLDAFYGYLESESNQDGVDESSEDAVAWKQLLVELAQDCASWCLSVALCSV